MKFNKTFKLLSLLCLVVIFSSIPMIAGAANAPRDAQAEHAVQAAEPPSPLSDLVETAKNLGGVALFFAALLNVGKLAKVVKDDQIPTYNLVAQTLSVVVLVYLQITGKSDLVPMIDKDAGALANSITGIVALIYQLFVARIGHEKVLAGLPLIGKSFSGRTAGDQTSKYG
jgi:hypothetical protein